MNGEASSLTRILFVDDSRVMVKTAFKILSAEFDVVTAIDGVDAWKKLESDPAIQVLFTDINMPNCDGYELLKKVRSANALGLHDLPVILVTGVEDDEAARQQALDRGATDFLSKKFLSTELLTRARAHAKYQRVTVQMHAQSTLDPLTGLDNASGFIHRLEQDIAYARRHGQGLALLRVQIDDLAATLQDRGNAVVEQIVVHVANLIRGRIREEDTAARIGLGGFAISLPGGQLDGIEAMAAKLHSQARFDVLEVDGRRLPISLSTAVVSAEQDVWTSAQDALDRCQAVLDQPRPQVSVLEPPAAVALPQPAASETTPPVAATRKPEPVTAQATPTRDALPRDPAQAQPKQRHIQQVPSETPTALQRLMSSLRALGTKLRERVVRFLQKLGGK